jgi:bifunctional UDP-N-acetylglucosamine pyrophosphorylase/glucosamine-1-phosphate N-acetyltransferase
MVKAKATVVALKAADPAEVLGANTLAELASLDAVMRMRKCHDLMTAGVSIYRHDTCVIDPEVEIGADTIIEPFVQILGSTRIGSDCRIRSFSVISDSQISDNVSCNAASLIRSSSLQVPSLARTRIYAPAVKLASVRM